MGLKRNAGLFCLLILGAQVASAVDSSGRNSHFWVTLRPRVGAKSGASTDAVFQNGYRSVNLDAPEFSCTRADDGPKRVYRVTWTGNSLLGDAKPETLQFSVVVEAGGEKTSLQDVRVDGAGPAAKGLVLESTLSTFKPRKLNGKRPPKNYSEVRGSIVLRNPALTTEDPEHPFSDLKNGHEMGPTPYPPTTPEKLKAFPSFSWDKVPRGMLIRKSIAYTDEEIKAIADNYDLVVLEKANGAGKGSCMEGMLSTGSRLKKINPYIKVLFYWNSRIFFGHYGIDDTISKHRDEWIAKDFVIRGKLATYVRENPDFLKWWVGCCEKMIAHPAIDGTFVDKSGVPDYMLDALYKATPNNKLVMNNNSTARQRIGYVDGTYREGWSGANDPDTIAETIAIARETGLNKKMQILRMPVKRATNKREIEDGIDRGLAIFLLFAEEYSYFYWQKTVDAKMEQWQWEASYVDQLNRPLGKPLGPYFRDNKVYTRSFEHCDVYMDLRPGSKYGARALWKNDIGQPGLTGGGTSSTDNTYKIQGSGEFSGTSDQFFYLSDAHYGDGEVKACVDSLDSAHVDAKAGVMFRESLAPGAKAVAVHRDPAGRMHMVYRATQGGALVSAGVVDQAMGPYAKLVRSRDSFVGHCSPNGETWTQISDVAISMNEKIEMGMAVSSQDNAALATATFSALSRVEAAASKSE